MRRQNLYRLTSLAITTGMLISMCGCSAKISSDNMETVTEVETGMETETESTSETETKEETSSGNRTSANNTETEEKETETESEPSSEESSTSEEEDSTEEETADGEEDVTEEESTNSKTSEKDSTKSETTTSETTTEAVTVQSVSAVVNGTHYVGETLTGADFTVTVKMSDGETLTNPDGWSAQPLTLNSTSNLLTISYEGASVTITVNAEEVPETTTAQIVAEATTQATTAATTQAETTTAAPETTAAETTTAVETATEGVAVEVETIGYIVEEGEYSYEFALALFDAQNDLREEIGLDDFIWDDELYEVAKKCAKICGDAGVIDHSLTAEYTSGEEAKKILDDGTVLWVVYPENLSRTGVPAAASDFTVSDLYARAKVVLNGIKNSPGHYKFIQAEGLKYTAIAAYRSGTDMYISYLFYTGDEAWMP